ncbi:MAG: peptidoglycan DD-metalloendopeptidase family protein [Gammaproteobacteria bacterium]|nr:peptidoglycan DD-metalloendopeptidase family protein [Gammaproteobacteria bacterium]
MKTKAVTSLLLTFMVSSTQALAANSQASPPPPKAKAAELRELRGEIGTLRSTLATDRRQQEALRAQLHSAEAAIGKTSRSLAQLQQELRRHSGELEKLRQRQRQLQENLAAQRQALAQQLRTSYAMGRQDFLKILLNQQDPAALGRNLTYYDFLNRARVSQIDTINGDLAELAAVEQSITEKNQLLTQAKNKTEEEKNRLEENRKQRGLVLAQLSTDIQTKEQQLQRLLEDERQLGQLLKRLKEAQRRAKQTQKPPAPAKPEKPSTSPGKPATPEMPEKIRDASLFASLQGRLRWPAQGQIAAHYGTSRGLGASKWQGVLIAAPEGQDVHAISRGRVVFADWLRGFGLMLIVDHGDGYMSLYGQNQNLRKNVGDAVESGEAIASVGNSGGHMNPGLYFEIRRNGAPVNPALWCR